MFASTYDVKRESKNMAGLCSGCSHERTKEHLHWLEQEITKKMWPLTSTVVCLNNVENKDERYCFEKPRRSYSLKDNVEIPGDAVDPRVHCLLQV